MSKISRAMVGACVGALLLAMPVLAADAPAGRTGGPPAGGGGAKPGPSASQAPRGPSGSGSQARASRGPDGGNRNFSRREGGGVAVQQSQRRIVRGEDGGGRRSEGRGRGERGEGRYRGTRFLYGGLPFYYYDGYYHGDCSWLRRRWQETGSGYWRQRYRQCRELD